MNFSAVSAKTASAVENFGFVVLPISSMSTNSFPPGSDCVRMSEIDTSATASGDKYLHNALGLSDSIARTDAPPKPVGIVIS